MVLSEGHCVRPLGPLTRSTGLTKIEGIRSFSRSPVSLAVGCLSAFTSLALLLVSAVQAEIS